MFRSFSVLTLVQDVLNLKIVLEHALASKDLAPVADLKIKETVGEEDDQLAARLRALRPAT